MQTPSFLIKDYYYYLDIGQRVFFTCLVDWDTLKFHIWQKASLQNKFKKLINTLGFFAFIILKTLI